MRLQLIVCDMLMLPVEHLRETSPHELVLTDLSASLHVEPLPLRGRIQAEIDRIETEDPAADAIILGYGLCGGATSGLIARSRPLVLPRAHDCATIFLGSRRRYQHEHETTPGTYWFTEDNVKRGNALKGWLLGDASRSDGISATYEAYVEKYGQDNADYLMEVLGGWREHYRRAAFVELGIGQGAAEATVEAQARAEAQSRGWTFDRVAGDLMLIRRLIDGDWDPADFLVLRPGERLAMSYDDAVIRAEPAG
jgi:Protein of unknown function (DUF1638)